MRIKKWDLVICLFLTMFLAVFAFELQDITPIARIYPLCVMAGSFMTIVIVVIQALRAPKFTAEADAQADPPIQSTAAKRIVIYCIAILVYIVLMDRLGYMISTILFAVFSLLFQKSKNKILIIVLPIVAALAMYFIFSKFLFTTLPTGSWIERIL